MKVGVLYSGGKDSNMAFYKAKDKHDIKCLISLKPKDEESYMFHFPNIDLVKKQAKVIGLPLMFSRGDDELKDLEKAILNAKLKYKIDGLVAGAVESNYQKKNIEKICKKLKLKCINPLWHIDHKKYLSEIMNKFDVIITGVAADGFNEKWIGRKLDSLSIEDLKKLNKRYKVSLVGEGGEYETFVLNAPFFKRKLRIIKNKKIIDDEHTARLVIDVI